MEAKGLFNVARKEFIDHLTSRKFILILALFLIISAVAMHDGMDYYNHRLENYKEHISQISQIKEEKGGEPEYMPEKPSILLIFQMMSYPMSMLGAILTIAMGFDLITRERESRSLKSLLSHPVYRDEIINGKALGGILALVFAVGIAFLILFAMLLLFSIVPDLDEFWRIILFGAVTVMCLLSYFSIALMASTSSENSGRALIYALLVFFAISFAMPVVGGIVTESMIGEPPEPPEFQKTAVIDPEYPNEETEEWLRYEEEREAYWEKRLAIRDVFGTFSLYCNYDKVAESITDPYLTEVHTNWYTPGDTTSIRQSLERVWESILALIILPVVFFAIAYVKFMRLDIR
ncbi:MAG: ABC transporter permease subunit [Halobacteriota archaeon]